MVYPKYLEATECLQTNNNNNKKYLFIYSLAPGEEIERNRKKRKNAKYLCMKMQHFSHYYDNNFILHLIYYFSYICLCYCVLCCI